VPHADLNQAQRVMCEPAHNPRHQGVPVLPMPLISVPERQRLPSRYRPGFRGDSEKATVIEAVASPRFRSIFCAERNDNGANCTQDCAQTTVPQSGNEPSRKAIVGLHLASKAAV
jgi:hypothetical protein